MVTVVLDFGADMADHKKEGPGIEIPGPSFCRGPRCRRPDRSPITLRFNPATESFDDAAVTAFLADKDVCAIRDHFFVKDDIPYLTR